MRRLEMGPISLGRLTKFLLSPSLQMRMRGLNLLHVRLWPASKEKMIRLLERAGLEVDEPLIDKVLLLCRPCLMWGKPAPRPQVGTGGPSRLNEQVEVD